FDFEETARGQEAADRGDDAAAVAQRRAAILAHDQIEIALAIARLEIGEAVIFLRQRQQRLGRSRDLGGIDRQFAARRAPHLAFDADDVAEIEQLQERDLFRREEILVTEDLDR